MIISKKLLFPALLLLSGASSQNAFAISAYNSDASVTYSISASNINTSGSLDDLDIFDDGPYFYDDFTSSSSQTSESVEYFSDLNTSYSHSFQAEDTISDGSAYSESWWEYSIGFENFSANSDDTYKITIDYSYDLTARAIGENADTDAIFEYESYNGRARGYDYINASITGTIENSPASTSGSKSISFFLEAGEFEEIYFDIGLTGYLEATPEASPVPVPAAFWLFGSALLAFPRFRKS